MISTIFNGAAAVVLNDEPDWGTAVETDFAMVRDRQASLTHRETRRPYSATMTVAMRYMATVRGSKLKVLIGALRGLNTQPVIVPFWPAIGYWSGRAAASWSGGLILVWKADWSQWEMYAAGEEPGWPAAGDFVAPALMGFVKPTKCSRLRRDVLGYEVDFTESSPVNYAITPDVFAPTAGPQPAGYAAAPPLLPFYPDAQALKEQIAVEVQREQLGFGREQVKTFYPQFPEHAQEGNYSLEEPMASRMASFFLSTMGPGATFWAPSSLGAFELTADAAAADTVLSVRDASAVAAGDYVLIFPPGAPGALAPVARKVNAVDLAHGQVTLSAAAGVALPASGVTVFQLCLARLDKPTMRLAWQRPGFAVSSLAWTEVSAEYVPPVEETVGVTLGALAGRAFLYEFSSPLGGVTLVDRFTSYEAPLNYGGNAYATANLNHGQIKAGLALDLDRVTISAESGIGGALIQFALLKLDAPLYVTIRQADVSADVLSNVVVIFTGEITRVNVKGKRLEVTAVPGSTLFDRQVPRFLLQLGCNHALFSPGCALAKADWKFTGAMNVLPAGGFPFGYQVKTLAGAGAKAIAALAAGAVFENWFAGGWIEFGGAGANFQARAILASDHSVPGLVTLTLDRDASPRPLINAAVVLYPGCDGVYTTCQAFDEALNPTGKFNNYANFGGHPFIPASNPSLVAPAPSTNGGKK